MEERNEEAVQEAAEERFGEAWAKAGMRITRSASKGREVRANRSFSKGQTLLVLEPYVHTLNTDHLLRCCHWCLRGKDNVGGQDSRPLSLRRCSGCKYRRYCSVDCQRKDWEGLHRSECNILQSIGTPQHVPPAPLLLLWRLLLLREKERRTGKKNASCQFDLVQSLHSHQEDYSSERKEQLAMMAAMACKHLSAASSPSAYSSGEEGYASREGVAYALDLLCMLSCNCFTISTDEMNTVGVGLYPQAALINHSCQPNCVSLFVGASFHLRSIVDINEGDEMTLNYVHIGDPTERRRKALRETFFFECQCTHCQQFMPLETVLSTNAERLIAKAEKTFEEAQALKKRNETQREAKDKLARAFKLTTDAIKLSHQEMNRSEKSISYHPLLLSSLSQLVDICISLCDWDEASLYCDLSIPVYEYVYPQYFPLLGLQYAVQGKLRNYLHDSSPPLNTTTKGTTKHAAPPLRKALRCLEISHGKAHPRTLEVERLLQEARVHDEEEEAAAAGERQLPP